MLPSSEKMLICFRLCRTPGNFLGWDSGWVFVTWLFFGTFVLRNASVEKKWPLEENFPIENSCTFLDTSSSQGGVKWLWISDRWYVIYGYGRESYHWIYIYINIYMMMPMASEQQRTINRWEMPPPGHIKTPMYLIFLNWGRNRTVQKKAIYCENLMCATFWKLLNSPGDVFDCIDVIAIGKVLKKKSLKTLAFPKTSDWHSDNPPTWGSALQISKSFFSCYILQFNKVPTIPVNYTYLIFQYSQLPSTSKHTKHYSKAFFVCSSFHYRSW